MAIADTTKPILKSLKFATKVDVTNGGQYLSFIVGASDVGLGVASVSIKFHNSWQGLYGADGSVYLGDSYGFEFSDGVSSKSKFIDSNSAPGDYEIDYLVVNDMAGNSQFYYTSDLAALGLQTSFEVISNAVEDKTRPTLTALSFDTSVDVTSGGRSINFTVGAGDIGLGVTYALVSFRESWQGRYEARQSVLLGNNYGDDFSDGVSKVSEFVDSTSAAGRYEINYVAIYDKAGNSQTYYTSDLAAMGFQTSFDVVSNATEDETNPTLTALSFTTSVDVTDGAKSINFAVSADDIGLGVDFVSIDFRRSWQSPYGARDAVLLGDGYGDDFSDGVSKVSEFIMPTSAVGRYEINYISIYDKAGNRQVYYASDLMDLGMQTSFEVIDRNAGVTASISSPTVISEGATASFLPTLTLNAVTSYTGTVSLAFDAANSTASLKDADVPSFTGSYSVSQSPAGDYVIDLPAISIVDDLFIERYETLAFKVTASGQVFDSGSDSSIVTVIINDNDRYGTGADDVMTGDGGNNFFVGRSGNDRMSGEDGTDRLVGDDGDDLLDGGSGADALLGGIGRDWLYGGTGDDRVGGGDGNDGIFGADGRDVLFGDAGNDTIEGGEGTDFLFGDAGTDTLSYQSATAAVVVSLAITSAQNTRGAGTDTVVGFENIRGSGFDDRLTGDEGRNIINGLDGADVMIGLGGDDSYYVDDAGDKVVEKAGGGYDSVTASVDYKLGAEIEALTLTGRSHIDATGNALDNLLTGNSGNNRLSGGAGADRMVGKGGNDIYYVDNVGDVVDEQAGEGRDTVVTTIAFDLRGKNAEDLRLVGSAHIDVSGNGDANDMRGNAGNNILRGDGGNDVLTGGAGIDYFVFDTAPGAGNIDRITDFSVADDTIAINPLIFTAIGSAGTLAAGAFQLGTGATEADDRILYDGVSGNIFYDADGNGAGAAVLFAQVTAGTALSNADFIVIG